MNARGSWIQATEAAKHFISQGSEDTVEQIGSALLFNKYHIGKRIFGHRFQHARVYFQPSSTLLSGSALAFHLSSGT